MRFTIRQLMLIVALLALSVALPLSIYRSYNHQIALFDVGDGVRVEFRCQYENWRGPRRILSVKIYESGGRVIDLTTNVPTYYFARTPRVYFSADRECFCVTYPDRDNCVLGDITAKDYGTKYLGNGSHMIWQWPENKVAERWMPVLESINSNNPEFQLELSGSRDSPF